MKVAVIGAGAIGALAAGYLAEKGEEIVLVARPEQAAAISQNGLAIEGARGKITVQLDARDKLDEKVDLVILATKTQDLEKAVTENLEYLKGTPVLTVQNGVRAEELIAGRLGKDNLFASIVMFGATYLAPGRVVHNFEGNWILGCPHSGTKEPLENIATLTSKIFPSPLSENIMGMKWLKLFLNANNCLPAIVGKSMQETFADISVCKISLGIWKEGWRLLDKAQIQLASLPDFPLERIKGLISMPEEQAAEIFSGIMTGLSKEPLYGSILQSIKRNRPSEIDYINGEFLRVADALNQDAPLNRVLLRMVSDVEKNKQFFSEQELISQTAEVLN